MATTLVKVFHLLSRLKDYLNIASPGLDTFVYIMRVRIPIMKSPSDRPIIKEKIASHLEQLNHHAAGIDLGSAEHWVCVPEDRAEQNVRRFGCFTADLIAMADWLIECGVTTVAMEATGVYWIPVFQMLETRGLEIKLFNLREYLFRMVGVDFTLINGLDALGVQNILAEVGLEPHRFPTVKHFCSWLGLCPGQKITGGKIKSSKTRPVENRAATAFRLAAFSLTRSRSALGAFYRRLRSRLGAPKAITATAHKIAQIFYKLWATGGEYSDPGMDYYEQKYHEQILTHLQARAAALGLELVPIEQQLDENNSSIPAPAR